MRELSVERRGAGLKGDRAGQCSIRVNQQWRICFRWTDAGPEAVEFTDYH
ncbi:type II toxin-antitoxin system RelE/ParE family toxin [Saccharopolyspora cebuensis]|uniref:Type II toxin-antitoxin system RelE/ParE family toxin n=1 Tax=Saccharopolyspora cebuensis TaxID=418759 RepID=A0ABV4CKS4_9PSEU